VGITHGFMMFLAIPAWIVVPLFQAGTIRLLEAGPFLAMCLIGLLLAALFYRSVVSERGRGAGLEQFAKRRRPAPWGNPPSWGDKGGAAHGTGIAIRCDSGPSSSGRRNSMPPADGLRPRLAGKGCALCGRVSIRNDARSRPSKP
jgi:hypothetical protein